MLGEEKNKNYKKSKIKTIKIARLDDWVNDPQSSEISFRLMPKR